MKIELWVIGKTKLSYAREGIDFYLKRIKPFSSVRYMELPQSKHRETSKLMALESEQVLKNLQHLDRLILLDDKGTCYTSLAFSKQVSALLDDPTSGRAIFVIGGAYGFAPELYSRAQQKWSLSTLTFTHDMARLIFLEQLYRSFTIMNNIKYHHE